MKKSKASNKFRKNAQRPREQAVNPFERLSSGKKFDVLGRKKKGGVQEKSRLRSAATELRKNTLLVEYRQLRKANAFIDRRFGEGDDTLSAEEKALMRFQKQRMQEMAGGKFALPDEGEDIQLTHLGRSLAEAEGLGNDWAGEDEDDGLPDYDVQAHFGGGNDDGGDLFQLKPKGSTGDEQNADDNEEGKAPEQRKTKAEVMQELIAKSKAFRAAKQQQREEDVQETEALDKVFRELGSAGALSGFVRPKNAKMSAEGLSKEDRAFDVAARELVFEGKAGPSDRLKSAAELEAEATEREQRAEADRRRRARAAPGAVGDGTDDDDADAASAHLPAGGYAARRARRVMEQSSKGPALGSSGDALEDDFDLDGSGSSEDDSRDDEGSDASDEEVDDAFARTALDARRQARAAGDDPLQVAFREAAKRLLKRHGKGGDASGSDEEDEESSDEDEGSSEEEAEDEGSSAEEEEEDTPSSAEEEGGSDEEAAAVSSSGDDEAEEAPISEDDEDLAVGTTRTKEGGVDALSDGYDALMKRLTRKRPGRDADATDGPISDEIAEDDGIPALPQSYPEFAALAEHFVSVATAGGAGAPAMLDALSWHLVELTPAVPFYAASLARARLQRWSNALSARLADPLAHESEGLWPAPAILATLLLLAVLFPASDRRHPVLTPATLFAGRCLSLCPVRNGAELALALGFAGLLSVLHTPAERYSPEPLGMLTSLTAALAERMQTTPVDDAKAPTNGANAAVGVGSTGGATNSPNKLEYDDGAAAELNPMAWLTHSELAEIPVDEVDPPSLSELLAMGSGHDDTAARTAYDAPAALTRLLCAAVHQAARCAESLTGLDAAPEGLQKLARALRTIAGGVSKSEAAVQPDNNACKPNGIEKKKSKKSSSHASVSEAAAAQVVKAALPAAITTAAASVLERVESIRAAILTSRRPMVLAAAMKQPEIKQYNPRFEEGFVQGKDYDPDRERSERRKLQRAVRKEQRGAARELRKDTVFMSGVRDREKASRQAALDKSAKRAMSFLQQQESDYRSGGQGGMWKKGKKLRS